MINVDNGNFITYSSLNFGSYGATSSIKVTYSKGNHGGRMEIRLNGPDGDIIGEFSPSHTGGWHVFEDETIAIDHVEGVHDLTLVAKDVNGVFDMKSFELIGTDTSDKSDTSPTMSPKSSSNNDVICVDSLLEVVTATGSAGCDF